MESDYTAGLLGRPDLASGFAYYQPVVTQGGGSAVIASDVSVNGVGTGQASLTVAGAIVLALMFLYWGTRGRQH